MRVSTLGVGGCFLSIHPADTSPPAQQMLKQVHPSSLLAYLFCAVKVSLWRCGPLYTTLLSPWLARAPSVRAMEPMAEGWRREIKFSKGTWNWAKPILKICVHVCVCAFLTSWYTEGLEREGTVNDNILLCPSLSTISCEGERQWENVSVGEKTTENRSFFRSAPSTSKERVLISSSALICNVWVFVCGPQGLRFPT